METISISALKIDTEPKRLLVTSEPYVIMTALGYQAVVNVIERKSRREHFIYIGPKSLAKPLDQLRQENGGKTLGLEFWLRKKDGEKYSEYILEE
jgi:hypothetical protein